MDITKLIVAGTVVFCVTVPFVASHTPRDKAVASNPAQEAQQDAIEPDTAGEGNADAQAAN